jgi:hypothetical protein
MPLHLVKLCVGVESISELADWIKQRLAEKKKRKLPVEHVHITRMIPKRTDELLDGGSLYWVIRGQIAVRQRMLDLRSLVDQEGVSRCHIVLEPELHAVMPSPRRPFQGWRYLPAHEAPPDLTAGRGALAQMPEELRRELRELGLL